MALVDEIEFYGRAVESQSMTCAAAAQALAQASSGGLTEVGAKTAIDQWKTIRATYGQRFKEAGDNWARCHGIVPPDAEK